MLLDDQDRSLWNQRQITEGRQLLRRAVTRNATGPYAVQAAIADLHLQQPHDWHQIAVLYDVLARQTGSAVVELKPGHRRGRARYRLAELTASD